MGKFMLNLHEISIWGGGGFFALKLAISRYFKKKMGENCDVFGNELSGR